MSVLTYYIEILLELSAYLSTRYSNVSLENFLVRQASRLRQKKKPLSTQCVAILGASFNPTTLGHVDFIRCMLHANPRYAHIFLIPTGQSPLKTAEEYASVEHRLQILDLVLQTQFTSLERASISVETTEARRRSPSWMVMTLTGFILRHRAQESYVLVCGYDHVYQMRKWYRWRDLANLCELHFYPRAEIDILNMTAVDACISLCQTKINVTLVFSELSQKEAFHALCLQRIEDEEAIILTQYLSLICDPQAKIRASSASDIRAFYQNPVLMHTQAPEGISAEVHQYIISHHCYT